MLDADLAALYGVSTKVFNQAVKRNADRFPRDFMFQLTPEEVVNLKSQIATSSEGDPLRSRIVTSYEEGHLRSQFGTSNVGRGGRRYLPQAFTQEGVAMLSSVLRSGRAVIVNVAIMRAFVRMRHILSANQDLARRIAHAENRLHSHETALRRHDGWLVDAFKQIGRLIELPSPPKKRAVGFRPPTGGKL